MSKFDNTLAEAAYAVCNHGFAEDEFGTVDDIGWNALAVVSSTVLLNLDVEDDLIQRVLAEFPETRTSGLLVWIQEDSQGFVTVQSFGSDEGLRSGTDLVNEAYDRAHDEYWEVLNNTQEG